MLRALFAYVHGAGFVFDAKTGLLTIWMATVTPVATEISIFTACLVMVPQVLVLYLLLLKLIELKAPKAILKIAIKSGSIVNLSIFSPV
jgi:hypothetical protein